MGVRTRSATSSPVKRSPIKPISKEDNTPPEQNEPLTLFILPENDLQNARFLLLRHPRDGSKKRFYFCPQKGIYEFTKIAAPSIDLRSVLFTSTGENESEDHGAGSEKAELMTEFGYVNKAAEFFISTPFDAAFLLLPALMPKESKKALFQPIDDILEHHLDEDKHLNYVFKHGRHILEDAMERVCDKVKAGDENMYRLNEEKLLKYVLVKCERVVDRGLPPSMEERFVTRTLEAPVLSITREESTQTIGSNTTTELADAEMDNSDTQSSTASTVASTVFSEATSTKTAATLVEDRITPDLRHLQRLRTAFTFITSSYMPPHNVKALISLMESGKSSLDFTPLTAHLANLAKLRADAVASRSIGDFSRKRDLEEEEFNETREEKKRKLAEEEKRKKAGESVGLRALKKADISGMKKVSTFFTKAAPKAKS